MCFSVYANGCGKCGVAISMTIPDETPDSYAGRVTYEGENLG